MKTTRAKPKDFGKELFNATEGNDRHGNFRRPETLAKFLRGPIHGREDSIGQFATSMFTQVETGFKWAVDKIGQELKIPPSQRARFLEQTAGPRENSLFLEFASLIGLFEIAKANELGGLPVLKGLDSAGPRPLFDFTSTGALTSLDRSSPGNDVGQPPRLGPLPSSSFVRRFLNAVESSPLVDLIESQKAAEGAFDLFGASLEVAMASFNHQQISATPSSQIISFKLTCKNNKLVVDSFFQSRYNPVRFGLSRIAIGNLAPGLYGFETHGLGTPPPLTDPIPHQVDAQHTSSFTSAF